MTSKYFQGLLYQPDCVRCPFQYDKKVYPDGPIPAKLCYVGESPGKVEVEQGKGFVGPSGMLLWKLAESNGIKREDVFVSNAVLCYPRDVKLSTGVMIRKERALKMAAECCRKRLIYELLTVTQNDKNAVVVPLGAISMRVLQPHRKNMRIMQYRGAVMNLDLQQLWLEASAMISV